MTIFHGKRVFITGHTGFKGSWLAAWLNLLGAEVTGYALPPEHPEDHFVQLGLAGRIRHIEGDTRDLESVRRAMEEAAPEFVFHLAAQPLVSRSYREPKLTFDTNVGGAVNVLEAIRSTGSVRALVYITSDKCYRNREWVWGYRESDELGGADPYGASKACAEMALYAWRESYFRDGSRVAAAAARAGNVIGGGDWSADRIVPDCVRALRAAKPLQVRSPQAVRPWQHVLEPLSGYLMLAARLYGDEERRTEAAWNFGPDYESHRPVSDLVETFFARWGGGVVEYPEAAAKSGFHEAQLLYLNCDRAKQRLGWRPAWHFEESACRTADWYKRWAEGSDAWRLTESEIRDYTMHPDRRALAPEPAAILAKDVTA